MKGTTAVLLKAFLVRSSEITDFHHTSATNFRQTVKTIIHRLTEALYNTAVALFEGTGSPNSYHMKVSHTCTDWMDCDLYEIILGSSDQCKII